MKGIPRQGGTGGTAHGIYTVGTPLAENLDENMNINDLQVFGYLLYHRFIGSLQMYRCIDESNIFVGFLYRERLNVLTETSDYLPHCMCCPHPKCPVLTGVSTSYWQIFQIAIHGYGKTLLIKREREAWPETSSCRHIRADTYIHMDKTGQVDR